MSDEFPANSKTVRQPKPSPETEKKIESVLSSMAAKKKKSLLKRFTDVIVGGDSKTVVHYVIGEVIVPQLKDLFVEATSGAVEKMIYGESRPRPRYGARPAGPTNYTKYTVRGTNPIGAATRDPRDRPPNPTALPKQLDYEEILLQTRVEAETVLERMYDLVREYEAASIHDLKSLVGWSSSYTDQKWGWMDLQGSTIRRVREGYQLEFPRPTALD